MNTDFSAPLPRGPLRRFLQFQNLPNKENVQLVLVPRGQFLAFANPFQGQDRNFQSMKRQLFGPEKFPFKTLEAADFVNKIHGSFVA